MKPALIFLVTLFAVPTAVAQTKICGQVVDAHGQPVAFANVTLAGTYDGASADERGNFAFTTTRTGNETLHASALGFRDFAATIELSGGQLFITIRLREHARSLDAVTITAGSFTAGSERGKTIFRALDIVTTAGTTADIAGALNTLPGTQRAGESGRLFVRGGDGHETRTFIDGLMVLEPYGPTAPNVPSRGRFLPFMFKGMGFSTGGYSAEYGQALSSALVLDSKDKAETTRTDFGVLSVGADAAHTHVWGRGSIAGKLHYTNIKPYYGIIRQTIDWRIPPQSTEGHAALRQQSGKYGLLKLYANFNQVNFSLYHDSIGNPAVKARYDLVSQYQYVNATYRNAVNPHWIVRGGIAWTNLQNHITADTGWKVDRKNSFHGKSVVEGSVSEELEVKAGIEFLTRSASKKANGGMRHGFEELITSTFAEADLQASPNLIFRSGVRLEYNSLTNRLSTDPRFSAAYRISPKAQASLSYGQFRQSPKDELVIATAALEAERADHYILSCQRVENNRTFRVEGYYKRYRHLVKYTDPNGDDLDNSGGGFAQGAEIFWRDNGTVKNADYWISYSFLHTRRRYLDYAVESVPPFASAHNASVVYKHFITKLKSQAGMTWSFTSGRTYRDPNKPLLSGTTPVFADLSFIWSYLPRPALIVFFSCTNVLGRNNIFGYEFSRHPNSAGTYNMRPIGQPAKRFLFIGIFLTLSQEKTMNQLPNL